MCNTAMKRRRILCLLVAAAVMLGMIPRVIPARVNALSSDEIQGQIDELELHNEQIRAELAELEQQTLDNYSEMEQVIEQKGNIDHQITLLNAQIQITEEQIAAYSVLIADKQSELDDAQARYDSLSAKNRERIRAMEENGTLSYWSVLFKAHSFADFLDRLNMMDEIARADRQRLEELDQAAQAVADAREQLQTQKEELEQTKAELDLAKAELEIKRQESDALLADLVSRGVEFQMLLEEGEERLAQQMLELAQREMEYTEALQREWEAAHPPTQPEEPSQGSPDDSEDSDSSADTDGDEDSGPEYSGGWVVPCSYSYVSSPFDPNRLHPILGYVRPHNGIDLAASMGTPVYATRSGTVTVADYEWDGAGNYVFINHGDGYSSVYMHMDYYIVSVGEYVSAGEVIGYVGTTGLSEGPHLHFGIAYNGAYVNPASYISF